MIVTISREYGAAGLAVARGVAERLGYELLADQVPHDVAARLGTSADVVAARATTPATFGERVLGGLDAGTTEFVAPERPDAPSRDFDESIRREVERALTVRADAGDVVFLGRQAGAVLASRTDVVRVFLCGDRAWRIGRLVEAFGLDERVASADLDRIDAARRTFAKERYGLRWGDPHAYDLVADVSRLGIAATVATVVAATRAREAGA